MPQSSIIALWIRGCLVRNLCNGTFAVTANMEGSERSPGKQWGSQNALQMVSSVGRATPSEPTTFVHSLLLLQQVLSAYFTVGRSVISLSATPVK